MRTEGQARAAKLSGMHDITEHLRLPSPAPRPQGLAFDGERLWMSSIETDRLYAIEPHQWVVTDEAQPPGRTWGIAAVGDELRLIYGVGEEDDRTICRFVPGHGAMARDTFLAPEATGSHLSYDGTRLYVSQWYKKRLLGIDESGAVVRTIDLPRGVCGQVYADGAFYAITTDDEAGNDYYFTRVTLDGGTPRVEELARVPFQARGLAYDGSKFWTNHRENHQIVAFSA